MALLTPIVENAKAPVAFKWTLVEYDRAIESGVFGPDTKIELLGGEISHKMSLQLSPHSAGIGAIQEALETAFPDGFWVRIQIPLALDGDSAPEPDLAVVTGSWRDYQKSQPTTAVLIVEISDSSLAVDRGMKAGLYARSGIADYWIVNLQARTIEVHRDPVAMVDRPFGHGYASIVSMDSAHRVSPLAAPATSWLVDELIPDV